MISARQLVAFLMGVATAGVCVRVHARPGTIGTDALRTVGASDGSIGGVGSSTGALEEVAAMALEGGCDAHILYNPYSHVHFPCFCIMTLICPCQKKTPQPLFGAAFT